MPQIERIVSRGREALLSQIDFFYIELQSQEQFDPVVFDDHAAEMLHYAPGLGYSYQEKELKYVATHDTDSSGKVHDHLFVFHGGVDHDTFYYGLRNHGLFAPVASAGFIALTFNREGKVVSRKFTWHSSSLAKVLRVEQSEQYKQDVIAPALGEYFKIS